MNEITIEVRKDEGVALTAITGNGLKRQEDEGERLIKDPNVLLASLKKSKEKFA
jgi:hypothetical protein